MYPGNHTDSEILSVPRNLKTRPGAPETHLAYITDDEADLLEIYKPDTPHKGPHDVPNYDSFSWDPDTGSALESGSGSDWSGGTAWSSTGGSGGTGGSTGDASYEEVWAHSGGEQPNTYQPPEEVYGPGIAEGGETVYNYTSLNPDIAAHQGVLNTLKNMWKTESGQNTLSFFGWNPNNPYSVPAELINQISEGSIVSGNEAIESIEPWIGTWDDIGSGEHPMFPGGVTDYYDVTSDPFVIPYTGTSGSGGSGGGGYGWGSGGGGGGSRGSGGGSRMQFPGAEGAGGMRGRWGQSGLQRSWINQLRGYNRGGIVSLC